MTKVAIEMSYTATVYATVNLPDGKSWNDVDDYCISIEWRLLYIKFKGLNNYNEYEMNSIDLRNLKRPIKVWEANENGDVNYDHCLVGE